MLSFGKEFVLAIVRCLHDISDVVSWDSTKHEKPLCLFQGHLLDVFSTGCNREDILEVALFEG